MHKKILHAYKLYLPDIGGVQSVMNWIVLGLSNFFSFTILASKPQGFGSKEYIHKSIVHRSTSLGTILATPLAPFYIFRFWFYANRTDLVDYHYPFPLVDIAIALWFPKKTRLVVHWHLDIVSQKRTLKIIAPFIRRTLKKADRIVVASQYHIDSSDMLTEFAEKCEVIPYGVDIDKWAIRSEAERQRIKAYENQYPSLALFVGRLVTHKGLDSLLSAAAQFRGQLIIVGEGPLRKKIETQIQSAGLTGRVHLVGRVSESELRCLYHAAKFLVFPSTQENEAFGLVQIEAMSCRKPVINTSLSSAVPWVARDGFEAITVPPCDSEKLLDAMHLLLDDPVMAQEMGTRGYERAKKAFSMERFIASTKALYDTVLENRAKPSVDFKVINQ